MAHRFAVAFEDFSRRLRRKGMRGHNLSLIYEGCIARSRAFTTACPPYSAGGPAPPDITYTDADPQSSGRLVLIIWSFAASSVTRAQSVQVRRGGVEIMPSSSATP